MRTELIQRLRQIYVRALRLHMRPDQLPDDELRDRLGIDSVMVMEILITVETDFGIEIDNTHLTVQTLNSFEAFATYLLGNHANDITSTEK